MIRSKDIETAQLENLQRIAKTIVATFGEKCEVAIHDFGLLPRSLVHVEGNVTGRKPGAPITDLVLRTLRQHHDEATDLAPYRTQTPDGKILKSSTTFIRNASGKITGAFCINYDVSSLLETLSTLDELSSIPNGPPKELPMETFASNLNETVGAIIEQYIRTTGRKPSELSRKERLALVQAVESQGAFLVKGAVDIVARYMGVTKSAVYSYIKEARANSSEVAGW